MAVCRNCRYYDAHETKGYKGYCTTYRQYVDPDSMERGCTRFEDSQGGSGCYLTSACVAAKNLPDDCKELTVLRNFRDTYLKNQAGGKEDIEHYYKIAPSIVDAINTKENSVCIWEKIYNELILKCVEFIDSGSNSAAYELYRQYSLNLEKLYLS